jgi:CRISPR-associated protein Cmr2
MRSQPTALLTWSMGPVHEFIAQARRIADVWAGSYLLSHLTRQAIGAVHRDPDGEMLFPYLERGAAVIPDGLPNRFVCRIPAARAELLARAMEERVEEEWERLAGAAVARLEPPYDLLRPAPALRRQTGAVFQISWSWGAEGEGPEGYARAARDGARRFAAARRFRPFRAIEEDGEKCAICGERAALPDGDREHVRAAWRQAEQTARARKDDMAPYLRFDQGRLCLVCWTKRFFALGLPGGARRFHAFDAFQESEDFPYFAVVKMDGDGMGQILATPPEALRDGDLEHFHRVVSQTLSTFAASLRTPDSASLNLGGYPFRNPCPQLIYAGGDDVLFVCNPRDALPLAKEIRELYRSSFDAARDLLVPGGQDPFTISAAVVYAHRSHTAGLLLSDLETLLEEGAKTKGGRNAVAIQLAKRSGEPTGVILPWEGEAGADELFRLADQVAGGEVSSRQTYTLRESETTLSAVFGKDAALWQRWLADRLGRNAGTAAKASDLAAGMTPFFLHDRAAALRIARFLGRELPR